MFWELHRNSREQDMAELSQLLAAFFSYAAAQDGSSLDESSLCRAFPQSAQWLLDQFHGQQKNRKDLQWAVETLFQLSPARRQKIAQAVANDIGFDSADDPDCFFFAVPSLPEPDQSIVKAFFQYFYDEAFHRKRGPKINGHISGATRSEFSRAYYQANEALRKACPICLHRKSDAVKENDLEHYFPKWVYTPLILHSSNLMFICKDCNETYKGARDVLQAGEQPLGKSFRPYHDTVKEHAAVVFHRRANRDWVKLVAIDGTAAEQEKIENFDCQFKLEERWTLDIEGIFEQIRKCCANQNFSKEEVRRRLKESCENLQSLSEFPDKFLETAYLNWLCETMFDAFYDSL